MVDDGIVDGLAFKSFYSRLEILPESGTRIAIESANQRLSVAIIDFDLKPHPKHQMYEYKSTSHYKMKQDLIPSYVLGLS